MPSPKEKLGLIAGNGEFPFLVLDAARAQGYDVVVAAIKEETSPEIESRRAAAVHWLSLGELSKLIETFQREGVPRAVMAGQVKHKQIFSSIRPDWRLAKLLLSLTTRNTDSLLGAVAKVLADEGIILENSTWLARASAGQSRRAHQTRPITSRKKEHRLRPRCRPRSGAIRHRSNRRHRRSRLRCRRSHGRHRRDHRARRPDHALALTATLRRSAAR